MVGMAAGPGREFVLLSSLRVAVTGGMAFDPGAGLRRARGQCGQVPSGRLRLHAAGDLDFVPQRFGSTAFHYDEHR